ALIESLLDAAADGRATIAGEMLGRCRHMQPTYRIAALKTGYRGRTERRNELGIFAEAFVRASPANVLRHANTRSERPIRANGARLFRRDFGDAANERWIA